MSSRADQNGGDRVVKKRGRNFWVKYFEEKGSERRVLRSDGAKKKKGLEADTKCKGGVDVLNKRVLRSDIAKKTELNGTLLKKDSESEVTYGVRCEKGTVVGVERIEVKNNIGKVRDEDGINAANVAEKVSSGSEQKENTMKVTDESGIDVEDVAGVTYPGRGQNQSSSIIIQQNGAEQIMCEDESEVEERTMMLGVAGQMQANGSDSIEVRDEIERDVMQFVEELDADKKTVTEEVALEGDQSGSGMDTTQLDEEITVGEKCNARSDVADQSEMANIDNIIVIDEAPLEADHSKSSSFISRKNSIGQVTCKEIIRDGNRRVTRSTSAKQREEAEASEKRMSTEVSPRVAVSGNSPNFSERIGVEQIRVADVIKIENPGSVVSRILRQMETAYNKKKKITEVDYNLKHSISNMDYGAGMIKHEEIEVEEKKIRRSDHCKQNSGTKVIEKKVMDSDLKRKRSKGASDNNTISKKIKMETSKGRKDQYDETGKKKVKLNPSKNQGPGAKVAGPVTGQNIGPRQKRMQPNLAKGGRLKDQTRASETLKLLKDDVVLVDAKREASHISHFKSIRGRGGSVRRFSPGKKVGRPAKIQVQWENEENRENSRSASTVGHKGSSISGERKFVKKSSTVVSSGGGQLNREKISSIKKKVSNKAKIKPKISSPLTESKNMYYSNCKEQVTANGEHKTRPLSKQDKEAEILERRMAREKLRNDIKNMLLNAGWKIELRPRKSKDYADVVYISPKGYVYWSITKAYHMLEQQFLGEHDVKDTDLSRKSFKTSRRKTGSSSFSPIPMEVLNMLKKTISKRRTNKEIEEDRMKLEDGKKSRRMKKSTCPKSPKNKKFKDKSRKIKKRKKDNDTSCSTVKAVSYTCKKLQTGKFRKKHLGCALLVRGSNQEMASGTDVYVPYVGKRTIFSWMIDMGIMSENARVKYMNDNQPQTLLEGHITRDGIKCSCCSKILPVSKFGIHAGSELCQPYRNIFVEDAGISLLQCQINAWKAQESTCRGFYSVDIHGDDPNDDTCGICGDGGDLICCDGCPSTFHLCCLGIEMLPPGDWHCRNCSCRYCGLISGDSAQGDGGSISPLLSCHQCDEKYHERCARDGDAIPGGSNLSCVPFCGQTCRKLFKQLQMLLGVKNDMDVGFSWTLLQRYDDNLPESDCGLDQKAECNSKIAVALAVMDECFLPIIDQRSGINLIHNVVYNCGSNFSRLNYRSFYTFILERGDEIISVASLRIHGTRVAEMPFIGTRNTYRRQGMCRRLLNEIESALCSLNIEKLIIPAISELMDTWTNVFGFKPLEDLQEIRSVNMLVFPGTGLLQKPLLKNDSARQCESGDEDKPESRHHQRCEAANKLSLGSCIGPEPCTSDCESFRHKPNTKDVDPSFPLSVGCMNSASGVLTEIVDPSFGSEFQASKTPEIVLLTNDLPTDDPWSQHNHQAKCISSEVTANMPSLPHSDGSLVRPYFEGQQTSSAALSFTVEDSAFPRKHIFRASNEQIVDDSSNIGDQVAIIQPKFKALGGNSGTHHSMLVTEPLFAVENKFFTSTKKPNIDALSEDARYSILELKSEFSAPPSKPFANGDVDTVCENARHSILELKSESKPSADNGDASKCF